MIRDLCSRVLFFHLSSPFNHLKTPYIHLVFVFFCRTENILLIKTYFQFYFQLYGVCVGTLSTLSTYSLQTQIVYIYMYMR